MSKPTSAGAEAPAPDKLSGVRAKIERAKHHVRDLESRIRAFREANPYCILGDEKPQAEEKVFRIHVRSAIPADWPLIAGEAAHQLRSSLDHLAWQLVEANNCTPDPDTAFPIYETPAKYKAGSKRKVKGMCPQAVRVVEAVQPYQSGYELLGALRELDNIDKHRTLLIVASALTAIGFGCSPKAVELYKPALESLSDQFRGALGWPSRTWAIIEHGAKVGAIPWDVGQHVNDELYFGFEITFNEPKVGKGQPVLELLAQTSRLVEQVVGLFVPLL